MKQIETRKSKDWITQVMSDIKELRLEVDIESIKNIKKSNLKMMVTTAIREKSFQDLEKKKKNHSKVMKVKHERLEMQNYLKPNETNIKLEEAQEIFKMRSKMSEENMKILNAKYVILKNMKRNSTYLNVRY